MKKGLHIPNHSARDSGTIVLSEAVTLECTKPDSRSKNCGPDRCYDQAGWKDFNLGSRKDELRDRRYNWRSLGYCLWHGNIGRQTIALNQFTGYVRERVGRQGCVHECVRSSVLDGERNRGNHENPKIRPSIMIYD